MIRLVLPAAAVGLAASAMALAVPVTVQATGSGGPCSGAGTGHPVQHTGTGHTSFTDSHNNCVNFFGAGNTAFLNDSDNNLFNMFGTNNIVEDFNHSNGNTLTFDTGSSGNELNGNNANNWNVEITGAAVNDFIELVGTTATANDIVILASNAALEFTSGCSGFHQVNANLSGMGTEQNPIVIC